jgi:sRNA-binding carbon storage regulator CsrA
MALQKASCRASQKATRKGERILLVLSRTPFEGKNQVHIGDDILTVLNIDNDSIEIRLDLRFQVLIGYLYLGDPISIGDTEIRLLDVQNKQARLGFEAPKDIEILRAEIRRE